MKKIMKSFRLSEECIARIEGRDKKVFESGSDYLETAIKYFDETNGGGDGDDPRALLSKISVQLKELNESFSKVEALFDAQTGTEQEQTKDDMDLDAAFNMDGDSLSFL